MPGTRAALGLAAAAIAATIAVAALYLRPALPDAARVGDPVLVGMVGRTVEVTRLTVTTGNDRFTFTRDGDGWVWADRGDFPVPAERVEATLAALAELRLAAPLTARPDRYDRLGLAGIVDPASRTVRLDAETADGEPLGRILLGDRRRGGLEGRYVRLAFAARAWLADGEIEVRGDPVAWLDRRLVDIAPERVATLAVTDTDGGTLRLVRPDADADWMVDGRAGEAVAGEIGDDTAGLLSALDLVDVDVAEGKEGEAGTLTFALVTFDGLTVDARFLLSAAGGEPPWIQLSVMADGASDAVRDEAQALDRRFDRWVFRLAPERLDRFARALAALHGAVAE